MSDLVMRGMVDSKWWAKPTLLLMACCAIGCSRPAAPTVTTQDPVAQTSPTVPVERASSAASIIQFAEVTRDVGLRFQHHSPLTEQRHSHLVMGSGIGWLDFDQDGWPDLYCCQGASYATAPPTNDDGPVSLPSNQLWKNHEGTSFTEVTGPAGLIEVSYSMGIAAADYDNDGFVDLCVTGYEVNRLYHNQGDGTFTTIDLPQATQPGRLSASCTWSDIDGDGNLDLFVTNYARLGPDDYPLCEHTAAGKTIPIVCHPSHFATLPDLLYRNLGTGDFEEISETAGIGGGSGRQGLGVVAADLDRDGDIDFYVANDTTPNQLWENQGGGRFVERGLDSGTSTNRHGAKEAGMGVAVGDVDGNGQLDLFVTNFYDETNTLYRNEGRLLFADVTDELGLGGPSRLRLAFGTSLGDLDNDGWLDLFVANGHIHDRLHELLRDEPFAQLPQLFHNQAGRRFSDGSHAAGAYFQNPHVGRGSALADFDRDGQLDLAVNHLNDSAALLRNVTVAPGHWLRVRLVGRVSNRGGVGAMVELALAERTLTRCVQAGTSYLSCDEASLLIGLGACDVVPTLTVTWPGGRREAWTSLAAGRDWILIEGSGDAIEEVLP